MRSGIYKITNPEGKVYIGKSKDIDTRFDRYSRYKTLGKQPKLFNSFDEFGFKNHTFKIIDTNPDLEMQYIQEYDSCKNGLNSNLGGGGVIKHNEETKRLISIAGKKNKGKRMISHRKGKKVSEKHRLNISKAKKGIPNPKNAKAILQYDKDNNFIAEHSSIEQAALSVNGSPTAINNCLKKGGGATSSSYIWKYKKL
jgi:group I intron endonuclease